MIGALILLLPPVLAIYSVMLRNKALKAGQVGYVYEGKTWVSWVAVVAILATLFLTFGAPLITKHVDYAPDWEKLKLLIFVPVLVFAFIMGAVLILEFAWWKLIAFMVISVGFGQGVYCLFRLIDKKCMGE